MSAARPRHRKHGLAVGLYASGFLEAARIDRDQFVAADRRKQQCIAGRGPALKVGHFIDRQLFLATPITVEDADCLERILPKIDVHDAVLAKQAGEIVPSIWRDISVVGQLADTGEL